MQIVWQKRVHFRGCDMSDDEFRPQILSNLQHLQEHFVWKILYVVKHCFHKWKKAGYHFWTTVILVEMPQPKIKEPFSNGKKNPMYDDAIVDETSFGNVALKTSTSRFRKSSQLETATKWQKRFWWHLSSVGSWNADRQTSRKHFFGGCGAYQLQKVERPINRLFKFHLNFHRTIELSFQASPWPHGICWNTRKTCQAANNKTLSLASFAEHLIKFFVKY